MVTRMNVVEARLGATKVCKEDVNFEEEYGYTGGID